MQIFKTEYYKEKKFATVPLRLASNGGDAVLSIGLFAARVASDECFRRTRGRHRHSDGRGEAGSGGRRPSWMKRCANTPQAM